VSPVRGFRSLPGVTWLGDFPAEWTVSPLWAMFQRVKDVGHPEEPMLSVFREHGVVSKDSRENLNRTAEDRNIYQLIHPGWLAVNRMKAWQGSVGISSLRGIVSGHYICFAPTHDESPEFLNWLFRSTVYTGGYATLSRGVRPGQLEIDNDLYRQIPVLLPPLREQRAIAQFLDRETARIDALIAKQEQLIATLHERREAVVSEKLAGHPVVRLRRMVTPERPMTYGILQCGDPVDLGVPYIGPSDMPGAGIPPDVNGLRRTTHEIAAAYQRSKLAEGDIVVSIGPAYGKVSLLGPGFGGANLTQDTVRVAPRTDLVDARYLIWVLGSRAVSEYWDREIAGATFRRLNLGTLARTPIPLPPIEEQQAIVLHLDAQTSRIDALIAKAERFIELSKERRSALITAAVTGQIDVRGEVA
jgi:type I restriction enzyme S subunit